MKVPSKKGRRPKNKHLLTLSGHVSRGGRMTRSPQMLVEKLMFSVYTEVTVKLTVKAVWGGSEVITVLQKYQNAGIWNSSQRRYLQTIQSFLLITFIISSIISINVDKHIKIAEMVKKYFYTYQYKWPKWDKTSFLYRRFALKCAEQHKFKENK